MPLNFKRHFLLIFFKTEAYERYRAGNKRFFETNYSNCKHGNALPAAAYDIWYLL